MPLLYGHTNARSIGPQAHLWRRGEESTQVAELIVLVALLLALLVAVWVTFQLLGLLVTLLVAAVVGWVADQIVPGRLPYGWLGATVFGLLGSWLGSLLLGRLGPQVGGIAIVPALVGAVVLAVLYNVVAKQARSRRL
jgi:uncharacterized membrane protein YeaQ/YmgE (transglycosylase-associated protein family)